MKKSLLVIVAIAVLAAVAAPWVSGQITARRLAADVERANAEGEINVAIVDYARGWRESTARVEFSLPDAAFDDVDMPENLPIDFLAAREALREPVTLNVAMRHGPVLLGGGGAGLNLAESTIHIDPDTPGYAELLEELGIEQLFELRTVTRFGGRTEFAAEMPPIDFVRDDIGIVFSGAEANGFYEFGARRFAADGTAASLVVDSPMASLTLEQLRFASDSTHYNDLLRLGHADGSVARLSVTDQSAGVPTTLTLVDFTASFDVELEDDGEHARLGSAYRFASLSDGAQLNLSDLDLTATARGIDIDALTTYIAASQQAALQPESAAPLTLEVEDALFALLAASPTIEVAPMSVNWNDEAVNATLRFGVDGANLPPRTAFTLMSLMLGDAVSIDATVEMSAIIARWLAARAMAFQLRRSAAADGMTFTEDEVEALANMQAATALAQLVAQGMLLSTGTGYSTQASYAGGSLTINGNTLPFGFP